MLPKKLNFSKAKIKNITITQVNSDLSCDDSSNK